MLNISSKALHYIKFLNFVQAVKFPALDPIEERLLNYLAAAW